MPDTYVLVDQIQIPIAAELELDSAPVGARYSVEVAGTVRSPRYQGVSRPMASNCRGLSSRLCDRLGGRRFVGR